MKGALKGDAARVDGCHMGSRVLQWLIVPAALVVCLATALTITSLRARADDARVTQAVLSDVRAELSEESALEWEARATGRASAEILEAHRAMETRVRRELRTLARVNANDPTDLAHLRELVTVYQSAVDDMFDFVGPRRPRARRGGRRASRRPGL